MTIRNSSTHDVGGAQRVSERQRLEDAVKLYVHECFRRRTVARADELASELRVSRSHLSRFARQVSGEVLREILRRHQLERAQRLLRTTPLPVEQVALASAFGTEWSFFRYFKAKMGMTPAQYREAARAVRP